MCKYCVAGIGIRHTVPIRCRVLKSVTMIMTIKCKVVVWNTKLQRCYH